MKKTIKTITVYIALVICLWSYLLYNNYCFCEVNHIIEQAKTLENIKNIKDLFEKTISKEMHTASFREHYSLDYYSLFNGIYTAHIMQPNFVKDFIETVPFETILRDAAMNYEATSYVSDQVHALFHDHLRKTREHFENNITIVFSLCNDMAFYYKTYLCLKLWQESIDQRPGAQFRWRDLLLRFHLNDFFVNRCHDYLFLIKIFDAMPSSIMKILFYFGLGFKMEIDDKGVTLTIYLLIGKKEYRFPWNFFK